MCLSSRLSSLAVLIAAAVCFPFVLTITLALSLFYRLTSTKSPPPASIGKTCIVTGGKMTKALHTARMLKRAGCRVVMVETHKYYMVASRFSAAVDRFVTVPVPEQAPEEYLKAIKVLAYEEDADVFVPVCSPVASVYEAQVARVLPPHCISLSLPEAMTAALDDKVVFAEMARVAGVSAPDTQRMCSKEAVHAFNNELRAKGPAARTYILKNLSYDSMRRLDLFTLPCEPTKLAAYMADLTITADLPWGVQEFITGVEYSTCAVVHEGALTLYTDNVASISCFNYQYKGDARLRAWVADFCKYHRISGIVCIDFIIDESNQVPYAIECNPRMSSNITNFHDSPTAARAFLEAPALAAKGHVETPQPSAGETCWMAVEMYYALTKPGYTLAQRAAKIIDTLFYKKDAYFTPGDVLPFLALHFVHIPTLLARNIRRGNRWAKIDMCIGKLTEEDGD